MSRTCACGAVDVCPNVGRTWRDVVHPTTGKPLNVISHCWGLDVSMLGGIVEVERFLTGKPGGGYVTFALRDGHLHGAMVDHGSAPLGNADHAFHEAAEMARRRVERAKEHGGTWRGDPVPESKTVRRA